MSEAAVSTLEQLDSNLRDIDAVLDLVSVTLASPEASLHIGEVSRLINMSREIAQHCQKIIAVERSHH
ncbi:hypothetical protein AACI86_004258 [Escherichia coli]|uniref:hypothetical protein n=1 Tax=Escherichia coli TaxID=562 RepID=UPI0017D9503A|nr:hypothetical protein [Escherichia coli]EFC1758643.1 hypothetical protein [Escherichia coli]EGJ2831176.1 hypothetical protein [Escherichia coli]EGW8329979.1 hypothetical protein [Escherichia coli]EHO0059996.1 hypothetical protein [Escherichia coli]